MDRRALETTSLIDRARAGDRSALADLLAPQMGALSAFVRLRHEKSLNRRESSADLVQSICRQVMNDIDSLRAEDTDGFRAWLFRLARSKLSDRRDFHFADKRDARRDDELIDSRIDDRQILAGMSAMVTPSRACAAREELLRIESAVTQLPDDWREALTLVCVAKLSYADAAREMNKSEASLRQLLFRGRARLATLLDLSA